MEGQAQVRNSLMKNYVDPKIDQACGLRFSKICSCIFAGVYAGPSLFMSYKKKVYKAKKVVHLCIHTPAKDTKIARLALLKHARRRRSLLCEGYPLG